MALHSFFLVILASNIEVDAAYFVQVLDKVVLALISVFVHSESLA